MLMISHPLFLIIFCIALISLIGFDQKLQLYLILYILTLEDTLFIVLKFNVAFNGS